MILTDESGNEIEVSRTKVGFRRFELKNGIMCLNGKRIIFKGINRHEFDAKTGRAITKEDMLFDIQFMKKNNINAVRTCHYPNNSLWYQLCDAYGIYLIDETIWKHTVHGRSLVQQIRLGMYLVRFQNGKKLCWTEQNQCTNVTRITQAFSSGLAEMNPTAEKILLRCRNISEA